MQFATILSTLSLAALTGAVAIPEPEPQPTTPWAGNLPTSLSRSRDVKGTITFYETGACAGSNNTYNLPHDICFNNYRANAMTVWYLPPGCTIRYWWGDDCSKDHGDLDTTMVCVARGEYRNSFMIRCA